MLYTLVNVEAPVPELAESWRADTLVAAGGVEALVLALGAGGALVHVHARVAVLVQRVTRGARALERWPGLF